MYRIQVLDRVFGILNLLADENSELTIAELSSRLQLHKSTGHRLVAVLERNHYVERNPANGKYRLGLRLAELGMEAIARLDLREVARPELERLVKETGETAHLGVLREGKVTSVAHVESRRTLRTPVTVGHQTPAHCSSQGKAMLAFLPLRDLREFVRVYGLRAYTKNTITRFSALRAELERVRSQGYALDNEEVEEGLGCIGAPVRDHTRSAVAAVSIAGPASRLGQDRMPQLIESVKSAASRLSALMGHKEEGGGSRHLFRERAVSG
jgi:DNA-binding IclR family transcriptional regulator